MTRRTLAAWLYCGYFFGFTVIAIVLTAAFNLSLGALMFVTVIALTPPTVVLLGLERTK